MSAPLPAAEAAGPPATYEREGWHFKGCCCPLWGSECIDEMAREHRLCKVPDMFCGDAALRLHHRPSGMLLELSAADALRCCSWRPTSPAPWQPPRVDGGIGREPFFGTVRCQFADHWRHERNNPDVKEQDVTSDWTCSSPYWGSLYRVEDGGEKQLLHGTWEKTDEEMPMDLLQQRDEIHWYHEVFFWEDELADNGLCRMVVRVRVMPTFWLALLLCELRVDNVLIREVKTRFFFRFDSDHVLRDWTWREASYEVLRSRGIDLKNNPNISQTSIGGAVLEPADIKQQAKHSLPLVVAPREGRGPEPPEPAATQNPE